MEKEKGRNEQTVDADHIASPGSAASGSHRPHIGSTHANGTERSTGIVLERPTPKCFAGASKAIGERIEVIRLTGKYTITSIKSNGSPRTGAKLTTALPERVESCVRVWLGLDDAGSYEASED